jgi:hypothetical protein
VELVAPVESQSHVFDAIVRRAVERIKEEELAGYRYGMVAAKVLCLSKAAVAVKCRSGREGQEDEEEVRLEKALGLTYFSIEIPSQRKDSS